MQSKRLAELIEGIAPKQSIPEISVTGITADSRKVKPGMVFVAMKGVSTDGNMFIGDAVARGAVAVISDNGANAAVPLIRVRSAKDAYFSMLLRYYGNPASKLACIGITGTNGKSTTAILTQAAMLGGKTNCGLIGTIRNYDGFASYCSEMTTPDPEYLIPLMARMVDNGCKALSMEVSSHSLEQGRVSYINFRVGALTNIGRDHLDYHKTPESYRAAKRILFESLGKSSFAVLNADDPCVAEFSAATKATVITYGIRKGNVRCSISSMTEKGTSGTIHFHDGTNIHFSTVLPGIHNVSNILCAAAIAYSMGIDLQAAIAGIESVKVVPGRLQRVDYAQKFSLFVDYAHTPDALRNVLSFLKPLCEGRLICVFGAGGDRDRGKRPLMGKEAEKYADFSILTSDNPRSEDPIDIIRQIAAGMQDPSRFCLIPDRREAIRTAVDMARENDIIVIAGKGHETYQVFKNETVEFNDVLEAENCLKKRILREADYVERRIRSKNNSRAAA